jgi:hypothetical protein
LLLSGLETLRPLEIATDHSELSPSRASLREGNPINGSSALRFSEAASDVMEGVTGH